LLGSGGLRTIGFSDISNPIFSISFDNSPVKEVCISVPLPSPILFGSLIVVLFLFGYEVLVLMVELFLERVILLGWVDVLLA